LSSRANVELSPIPEADEHRDQRAPAEPVQSGQGQVLENFGFGSGVHLLHERDVHQVEEIEQADPQDPRNKVEPAQDQLGGLFACNGGSYN
jgi:hypothetical protein